MKTNGKRVLNFPKVQNFSLNFLSDFLEIAQNEQLQADVNHETQYTLRQTFDVLKNFAFSQKIQHENECSLFL